MIRCDSLAARSVSAAAAWATPTTSSRIASTPSDTFQLGERSTPKASGKRPSIAIVGAGATGLTLASELSHMGFDVTVLEANAQVGGKCASAHVDGRHYDMGAVAGVPWV